MVEAAGRPTATDKCQEIWEFSESESWSNHENEATRKPVASMSKIQEIQRILFYMSPAIVPHMEKVYSIVRKIYGRNPTDDLNDLDVNTAVWCTFMNVTLQAAVLLGRDYMETLQFTKNQLLKSVKQLFQVTEKVVRGSERNP